ncbi:nucleoid-associated protein YejK [Zophobihabitans entericus]|uniref:Nucleoid-associated protein IPMB12_06135 n=1 Tax=Zophobihabitans entericus TaxID=1635327 RepID=A0A6G9IAP8_9GAMM|nr:nucleoid-associated protein YejK [Zophobihabitans entericus]QIQ21301.1 nucleoid-associated protein YejK [Zophobihabitans entericus]
MSLQIEQIVLHQLVRKNENDIEVVLRDALLENNQPVINLIADINRIYNNKSKAYGLFNEESLFAESVKEMRLGNQDFLNFSQESTKQLRNELAKYPFADGGTVVFCLYRYLAVEYLMIAVLNSCDSMLVSDTLDISTTHYLDIDHADIIARVDLTEWQTEQDSKRYLTFLRGRVGRKVSDFFMDYLGASEGLNAKAQNKSLVQAVDDYCQEINLDKSEKQACRQQVYSYCNGQIQAGEEIKLSNLAKELPTDDDKNFLNFVANNEYDLDEEFPADRSTLRQLKKFTGSGGGLSIGFDSDLLGERVKWDPQTDTLVIKGTPPNLRDQLQRNYDK